MEHMPQESVFEVDSEALRESFSGFDTLCNEFIKDGGIEDINVQKTLGAQFVSYVAR